MLDSFSSQSFQEMLFLPRGIKVSVMVIAIFEGSYDNKVIKLNLVMELQPINHEFLAQNNLNFI